MALGITNKMKKEKKLHNRDSYKVYDKLLIELNTDCITASESVEDIINLRYLFNKGLIKLEEGSGSHKITLTPKGMVLRSEGGFIEQDNLRIKVKRSDILSIIATILSILAILIGWLSKS